MYTLFVILIVIAALLMIGIVLIQESKGGGLASNYSQFNQIGGVRKTTDFIEKTTWGLAAAMVVLSVACAYVAPQAYTDTSVMENYEIPATNPNNLPGFGASQQKVSVPASRKMQLRLPLPLLRLLPLPLHLHSLQNNEFRKKVRDLFGQSKKISYLCTRKTKWCP